MFEFYATAIFGILRWPVWTAAVYAAIAVLFYLTIGYGPELPENLLRWDAIFSRAVYMVAIFSVMQCVLGYTLGRLAGFVGRRIIHGKAQ